MKTYIVKDEILNLETKEIKTYYMGKDGYVHVYPEYCKGYSKPHSAKNLIKREVNNDLDIFKKIDDLHSLESGKWLHTYSVIEC